MIHKTCTRHTCISYILRLKHYNSKKISGQETICNGGSKKWQNGWNIGENVMSQENVN